MGRDKFSFIHDETEVGNTGAEDLERISVWWEFILVVDEGTKGEFMAREKDTKNRILEGVKNKKGNQQSSSRKID